ncbi:MAG: hypothetical protein WCK35_27930 [Chloroflexota bacterium]
MKSKFIRFLIGVCLILTSLVSTSQPASVLAKPFDYLGGSYKHTANGLGFSLNSEGLTASGGGLKWGIALQGFGRAGQQASSLQASSLQAAQITQTASQLEYRRGTLTEWYRSNGFGVQQGFTISSAPSGGGPVLLQLQVGTDLQALPDADQRGISFSSGAGQTLRYDALKVFDANGQDLPASLNYADGQITIQLDDSQAVYPITVDPLIYIENKVILAGGSTYEYFGSSVAISGDSAVISNLYENGGQGAVYVYKRVNGIWLRAARLSASDGGVNDKFGFSVAISGDTIVVGEPYNFPSSIGQVYVFVKPAGGWSDMTQTAILTASGGVSADLFGYSVGVSADTVVVGASQAFVNQGAAYVFVKPPSGWVNHTETAKLTSSDGGLNDEFGYSVAISKNTIAVGATSHTRGANAAQGTVYVFSKPGGGWVTATQTVSLVALDGAAFDRLGASVAISGDTIVAGAYGDTITYANQGSAYVFVKPGSTWNSLGATISQSAKLVASDGAVNDFLGLAIAINGNSVVVGKPFSNSNQGSVYVYLKPNSNWTGTVTQAAKLTASDGVGGDSMGNALGMDGNTILVGAYGADIGLNIGQGAAYFYSSYVNLNLSAVADRSSVPSGQRFNWVINLTNLGGSDSPNSLVKAVLPAGVTLNSATPTRGSYDAASGIWSVGNLAPMVNTSLTLNVTVSANPGDVLSLTPSLISGALNMGNNSTQKHN